MRRIPIKAACLLGFYASYWHLGITCLGPLNPKLRPKPKTLKGVSGRSTLYSLGLYWLHFLVDFGVLKGGGSNGTSYMVPSCGKSSKSSTSPKS